MREWRDRKREEEGESGSERSVRGGKVVEEEGNGRVRKWWVLLT